MSLGRTDADPCRVAVKSETLDSSITPEYCLSPGCGIASSIKMRPPGLGSPSVADEGAVQTGVLSGSSTDGQMAAESVIAEKIWLRAFKIMITASAPAACQHFFPIGAYQLDRHTHTRRLKRDDCGASAVRTDIQAGAPELEWRPWRIIEAFLRGRNYPGVFRLFQKP